MRKRRDYQSEILAAITPGETVDSDEVAVRLGVARNYLLQDLHQLSTEKRLIREQVARDHGGVAYAYRLPAITPWSEWPSWTQMTDLPVAFVR